MCEVVKVLERELENSGLIYVYQEGGEGKWYVYERSAYFLSRMMAKRMGGNATAAKGEEPDGQEGRGAPQVAYRARAGEPRDGLLARA